MVEATFTGTGSLAQAIANGRRLLTDDPRAAAAQAREILRVNSGTRPALRLLADALRATGRTDEAARADLEAMERASTEPLLARAAASLARLQLSQAEHALRTHLRDDPDDPSALMMLAQVAGQVGIYGEAEKLLRRVLDRLPGFVEGQLALARLLVGRNRPAEARDLHAALQERDPDNPAVLRSMASLLADLGDYTEALAIHERLTALAPDDADVRIGHAHLLKTVGRSAEAIAAYERALTIRPDHGEAWWSLANLKTFPFEPRHVAAIREAIARGGGDQANRLHLHFALGKALEDAGDYAESFLHYDEGNRLRRAMLAYDPDRTTAEVRRTKAILDAGFFAERRGWGDPSEEPIFVLGLPRSGSTLVEQILASHSMVEGTSELPYVQALVRALVAERWQAPGAAWPDLLGDLDAKAFRALGRDYLSRAAVHRKTASPRFIDKMPNNWADLGFIHLILPHARIVDVRRDPLDCCFSNFRQHFARGQSYAYSQREIGRFYCDYVDLMDHFDRMLPGRVHHVRYEELVDDPEREVRRLLDCLGLPFEDACLRFHESRRAVRTASAEQVRRPINRDGIGQWRNYEPWLGPLKDALAPVLRAAPGS